MNSKDRYYDGGDVPPRVWIYIGLLVGCQTLAFVLFGFYTGNFGYIQLGSLTFAFMVIFFISGVWRFLEIRRAQES